MKNNVLKEVLETADGKIEEFFNLYELPQLPDFNEMVEDIALNIDLSGVDYDQYINAAICLMLKKTLDKISHGDGEALRLAFNALSSTKTNSKEVQEIEDILASDEDEVLELPGDEGLEDSESELEE